MTSDEIEDLKRARSALARQRNSIARRLSGLDVAPISMAEDLTRTLLAIEAVDRALVDAGQPHVDIGSTLEA
jgi:hypothetical protein